jgi:dihydroorotase
MTLYHTDNTTAEEVERVAASGHVFAFKLYPAGATTNSETGVSAIKKVSAALAAMQKHGVLLLIHGKLTDNVIDLFDRKALFIDEVLIPI